MVSKPKMYVETSVVNNAVPNPYGSQDPRLVAATREFFDQAADRYDLYISRVVIDEVGKTPNPQRRQDLENFIGHMGAKVLARTQESDILALAIVKAGIIPEDPREEDGIHNDARHLAIVMLRDIDLIVSWNFEHIASEETRAELEKMAIETGKRPVLILTPEEVVARERERVQEFPGA